MYPDQCYQRTCIDSRDRFLAFMTKYDILGWLLKNFQGGTFQETLLYNYLSNLVKITSKIRF